MNKLGVSSGVAMAMVVLLGGAASLAASVVEERAVGAGNAAAAAVASASPLISSARKLLGGRIAKINDRTLAASVRDLAREPARFVCVTARTRLSPRKRGRRRLERRGALFPR